MSPCALGSGQHYLDRALGACSPLCVEPLLSEPPLQPFTSSACRVQRSPLGAPALLVTLEPEGSTAPPGILPEFRASVFPSENIGKVPASLGVGSPVLEALTTWPQPSSSGAPPSLDSF